MRIISTLTLVLAMGVSTAAFAATEIPTSADQAEIAAKTEQPAAPAPVAEKTHKKAAHKKHTHTKHKQSEKAAH